MTRSHFIAYAFIFIISIGSFFGFEIASANDSFTVLSTLFYAQEDIEDNGITIDYSGIRITSFEGVSPYFPDTVKIYRKGTPTQYRGSYISKSDLTTTSACTAATPRDVACYLGTFPVNVEGSYSTYYDTALFLDADYFYDYKFVPYSGTIQGNIPP
ncbi:MAG: hypothetical protein HY225_03815, partial [Candidatus Vogelbacteria bacterium]|nr:hypothetical protein [Candidatus Vogelbacteria bacterium]